jgi:hypothetical protein
MTTGHVKMEVEPFPETPHIMGNANVRCGITRRNLVKNSTSC